MPVRIEVQCPWCHRMIEAFHPPKEDEPVMFGHRVKAPPKIGAPWCQGGGRPAVRP